MKDLKSTENTEKEDAYIEMRRKQIAHFIEYLDAISVNGIKKGIKGGKQ